MFPEEVETLRLLPRQKITKEDVAHLRDGQKIMEEFAAWKEERDKKLFSS